ncbi:MAG TPA: Rrf2 family transcriptional regulator, partial [bacterium]|nr:Rrf2 family transcriptional regulator [bacterium]
RNVTRFWIPRPDPIGAHLSKVLQRLGKVGLVTSIRGPKGGFVLSRGGDEIALLEVYEAIDGPLASSSCLFHTPICDGQNCILGDLLSPVNQMVRNHLAKTKLSELTSVFTQSKIEG